MAKEDSEEVDEDNEDDEDEEDDSDLPVPFDIPIEGVNYSLKFPLGVDWDEFRWDVAKKLQLSLMDFELSYKLTSQPKGDLARALADENDFADLIQRSRPYVNGTKSCARGKEFHVQLVPKIIVNENVANKDGNAKASLTETQKVGPNPCRTNSTDTTDREKRRGRQKRHLEQLIRTRRPMELIGSWPNSGNDAAVTHTMGRAVL